MSSDGQCFFMPIDKITDNLNCSKLLIPRFLVDSILNTNHNLSISQ